MNRKPDWLDPGKLARELVCGTRLGQFDAEFVFLPARSDLGVGMRIDIGVDPDPDPRGPAYGPGDLAQPAQFRQRLDIDLMDTGRQCRRHFGCRLADPGEDDPLGRDAGNERTTQLALGDNIRSSPELAKMSKDSEVRVGLYSVADERALGGESLGKAPVQQGEASRGIEIERGPDGGRDPRDRDRLGMQLPAAIAKNI